MSGMRESHSHSKVGFHLVKRLAGRREAKLRNGKGTGRKAEEKSATNLKTKLKLNPKTVCQKSHENVV